MRFDFSIEPVENRALSNATGETVYAQVKTGKKIMQKNAEGTEVEVDEMVDKTEEMVNVIIPADRNLSHYTTVAAYRLQLAQEARDGNPQAMANQQRFERGYTAWKSGTGLDGANGTPLTVLPSLSKNMIAKFVQMAVGTVEALADLSDGQCQSLGMGTARFRNVAKTYLESKKGDGMTKVAADMEKLREEKELSDAKHAREMEEMQKQIAALTAAAKSAPGPTPAP